MEVVEEVPMAAESCSGNLRNLRTKKERTRPSVLPKEYSATLRRQQRKHRIARKAIFAVSLYRAPEFLPVSAHCPGDFRFSVRVLMDPGPLTHGSF